MASHPLPVGTGVLSNATPMTHPHIDASQRLRSGARRTAAFDWLPCVRRSKSMFGGNVVTAGPHSRYPQGHLRNGLPGAPRSKEISKPPDAPDDLSPRHETKGFVGGEYGVEASSGGLLLAAPVTGTAVRINPRRTPPWISLGSRRHSRLRHQVCPGQAKMPALHSSGLGKAS